MAAQMHYPNDASEGSLGHLYDLSITKYYKLTSFSALRYPDRCEREEGQCDQIAGL